MILHLVPTLYNPYNNVEDAQLISISIPDYGVELTGDSLNQGKPHPNKNYIVGMLKNGRKAVNGLLINLPTTGLKKFSVYCVWKMRIDGEYVQLTHEIINHIEGEEGPNNDLISHEATFWYAHENFAMRWPEIHATQSPLEIYPILNLEKKGAMNQVDQITLPVLERGRLYTQFAKRVPEKIWFKPDLS